MDESMVAGEDLQVVILNVCTILDGDTGQLCIWFSLRSETRLNPPLQKLVDGKGTWPCGFS